MIRTTIFADEEMMVAVRRIAQTERKSVAQVIREALDRLITSKTAPPRVPSLFGIGRSGRSDIAERHEELLWRTEKRRGGRR
jgi:hypothetical protein